MDGGAVDTGIILGSHALGLLMPMHVLLTAQGTIVSSGPTLAKLFPKLELVSQNFFDLFEIRRQWHF